MMIEGAVDQAVFDVYVEHFLVPKLCPGDVVLLDNIKFHHSPYAIRLIEQAGARVEHLPAYSPDFNPIEQCISKLKAILRGIKANTQRKLRRALARAMAQVTLEDIRGWFSHYQAAHAMRMCWAAVKNHLVVDLLMFRQSQPPPDGPKRINGMLRVAFDEWLNPATPSGQINGSETVKTRGAMQITRADEIRLMNRK